MSIDAKEKAIDDEEAADLAAEMLLQARKGEIDRRLEALQGRRKLRQHARQDILQLRGVLEREGDAIEAEVSARRSWWERMHWEFCSAVGNHLQSPEVVAVPTIKPSPKPFTGSEAEPDPEPAHPEPDTGPVGGVAPLVPLAPVPEKGLVDSHRQPPASEYADIERGPQRDGDEDCNAGSILITVAHFTSLSQGNCLINTFISLPVLVTTAKFALFAVATIQSVYLGTPPRSPWNFFAPSRNRRDAFPGASADLSSTQSTAKRTTFPADSIVACGIASAVLATVSADLAVDYQFYSSVGFALVLFFAVDSLVVLCTMPVDRLKFMLAVFGVRRRE
ncbi:hypothetical protein B0T14DRAFT_606998 [Immersiella caudata]|uniref:Uncharacterized protein n=1 Tax=Immersiella caudata TaxID=314043 RepID=A0AA39U4I0_9PEZI|nr:hypothetical protein B0T14DRAFT_606998 [Immersiella caudata]